MIQHTPFQNKIMKFNWKKRYIHSTTCISTKWTNGKYGNRTKEKKNIKIFLTLMVYDSPTYIYRIHFIKPTGGGQQKYLFMQIDFLYWVFYSLKPHTFPLRVGHRNLLPLANFLFWSHNCALLKWLWQCCNLCFFKCVLMMYLCIELSIILKIFQYKDAFKNIDANLL